MIMMHISPLPSWDADDESRKSLAEVLRRDGVDLLKTSPEKLARGTPVYIEAPCDPVKVLSRMARAQVPVIPVLWGARVLDLLDRVDLSRKIKGSHVKRLSLGTGARFLWPRGLGRGDKFAH